MTIGYTRQHLVKGMFFHIDHKWSIRKICSNIFKKNFFQKMFFGRFEQPKLPLFFTINPEVDLPYGKLYFKCRRFRPQMVNGGDFTHTITQMHIFCYFF